jgi:hypothetical protein
MFMMKRRKTLNKYTIGNHGQITNNQPTISPRTQKLLEVLAFAEMMKDFSSGLEEPEVEIVGEEDVVGEVIDVDEGDVSDECVRGQV